MQHGTLTLRQRLRQPLPLPLLPKLLRIPTAKRMTEKVVAVAVAVAVAASSAQN